MTEIREDMLKVKRMVSEVEITIGKREGETELVNKLIDAQNLLTYCMSRLENAIVPPCKVGDTVYAVRHWSARKSIYSFVAPDIAWIVEHTNDFGKTVFLTREEAEKALKERTENK